MTQYLYLVYLSLVATSSVALLDHMSSAHFSSRDMQDSCDRRPINVLQGAGYGKLVWKLLITRVKQMKGILYSIWWIINRLITYSIDVTCRNRMHDSKRGEGVV